MSILESSIETITIPRSYFFRPEEHSLTMEAGKIYPTYIKTLMPNDLVKINCKSIIRQQPTINPSFTSFRLVQRYFVVSIRNVYPDIYRFISGFKQYSTKTPYTEPMPKWTPGYMKLDENGNYITPGTQNNKDRDYDVVEIGEMWDCMGLPAECIPDDLHLPNDYIRRAYNYIYDLYFRNQAFEDSILYDNDPTRSSNEKLLYINYDKDYFTTGLPFQQLGEPMALPIAGNTKAVFQEDWIKTLNIPASQTALGTINDPSKTDFGFYISRMDTTKIPEYNQRIKELLNNNTVDMTKISSVLIADIRKAFALQMFSEMMARGGIRDNELLLMMWGTAPSDETLGRPYYLGSQTTYILTQENLQTSQTTDNSILGDMGGTGIGVGIGNEIRYHAKEFCILMCLSYIKPETTYGGQGMPKELSISNRFDFPIPVLSHISEQPVEASELLCASIEKLTRDPATKKLKSTGRDETAAAYNSKTLMYRPVYDNWRYSTNRVSGFLKKSILWDQGGANLVETKNLFNWTEARFFSIKDGERPAMNNDFFKVKLDNRNFAVVQDVRERAQFIVSLNTEASYWRALSELGTPGRLDHIL